MGLVDPAFQTGAGETCLIVASDHNGCDSRGDCRRPSEVDFIRAAESGSHHMVAGTVAP